MGVIDGVDVALEFTSDPAVFLDATGEHLSAHPVISTVVATVAQRTLEEQEAGVPPPAGDWWVVVRRHGQVIGAAMRTAPFEPRPIFVLPMPDTAAVLLARTLHGRAEVVTEVNGALPAAELCARELARLSGGTAEVEVHTRLHVLGELIPPRPVPGRLVPAGEDDLDLVAVWFEAFHADADVQGGRAAGSRHQGSSDRELIRSKLAAGQIWLWTDQHGERVHMTAANAPAFGVARVGPVYTPPGERGRGWASNAVAEVSRRIVAQGARACLFTDQANPTSNHVYAALGYEPVVDMAEFVIR